MREDILRDLQREIYDRCQKESNKFGIGCELGIKEGSRIWLLIKSVAVLSV